MLVQGKTANFLRMVSDYVGKTANIVGPVGDHVGKEEDGLCERDHSGKGEEDKTCQFGRQVITVINGKKI